MEAVLGQTRDNAVVVYEAVFTRQDAVTALALGERVEIVHVQAVQESSGVGAHHFNLAERGGIEEANAVTNGEALAVHCRVHVFTSLREVARTFPQADVFEHGTVRHGPSMRGRWANRVKQVAAVVTGEDAKRDGRVGHAEGGKTGFGQRHTLFRRHEPE